MNAGEPVRPSSPPRSRGLGTAAGAALGYVAFVVTYAAGVLVSWVVLDSPPFTSAGGLSVPWMGALTLATVVASLFAGWLCRRQSKTREAVLGSIGILLGLALAVLVVDAVLGPTSTGQAFVERLFGPVPPDAPYAALLEGRPQPWFSVASYAIAILGILTGAGIAARRPGPSSST